MKILVLLVTICILFGAGCNNEKSDYDAGIAAYKRGHYEAALYDFEKRANQGDPVAQFCLGYMYKRGIGVETNYAIAMKWYTKAKELNYLPAQNNLAVMHFQRAENALSRAENALGGRKLKESVDHLQTAMNSLFEAVKSGGIADSSMVQYNAALMFARIADELPWIELLGIEMDFYPVAVNLIKSASENGYLPAQNQLGTIFRDGLWNQEPDAEKAMEWYTRAANRGSARAQFNLAEMMNENGKKESEKVRVDWYRKAADQNFAPAQTKMGDIYAGLVSTADDSKKDADYWKEAVKWFEKAALQGDVSALHTLSLLYGNGKGVPKNIEKAMRLTLEAAQKGDAHAAHLLGNLFKNREPSDYEEAYYWYGLALKNGERIESANKPVRLPFDLNLISEQRDRVGKKLSEEVKSKIQERVYKWQRRKQVASGTAFYINKNHILTNAHVARWEEVQDDGTIKWHKYDELLIGDRYVIEKPGAQSVDHESDLALLFDPSGNMDEFATFRNNPVDFGEEIASFGYPMSYLLSYGGNVTPGRVSGLSGTIEGFFSDNPYNLFQHTAPIQPGNSGGPVFDLAGNVVGVTKSSILTFVGLNPRSTFQTIKIAPPQNG